LRGRAVELCDGHCEAVAEEDGELGLGHGPFARGMIHSFSERFKTRKSSLVAASSLGKSPLARTARRGLELSASMAFVVYKIRGTMPGKA
jgi:hypothetical protein